MGLHLSKKNTGSTQNPLKPTAKHVVGSMWARELDPLRTGLEPPTNPKICFEIKISQKMMSGVEPNLNKAKAWTIGRSFDGQGTLGGTGAGTGLGLRRVIRTPNRSVWKCWDRNLVGKPVI